MSARQPFVPGGGSFLPSSRPESRAAHASTASSAPPHFVPDPSNPLNGGPKPQNTIAENAPLNIGGLTKSNRANPPSRRQSLQIANHLPRPGTSDGHSSASNHIARPATSDPHSKLKSNPAPNHRLQAHSLAKSHNIAAPTPLQARSAPSLFSNPAPFKTPAIPTPHTPPPIDPRTFRFAPDDPTQSQMSQLSPDREDSTMRLKTLPSQTAPHRRAFGGSRSITDLTREDEIYEVPATEVAGRNKRGRSEVDDDEDDEHAHVQSYNAPSKRFKTQKQVLDRRQNEENAYPDENEMFRRSSSPHDAQEYPLQQPRHHVPSRSTNHPLPDATDRFPTPYSNSPPQGASEIDRIVHLIKAEKFDFNIEARVEKYERAAEKWKACTRDEWTAGADDLSAQYTKIFDFAKAHMAEKFQLFAVCDDRLAKQDDVLADRDALLKSAKDLLVADSVNVLGK